MASEMDPSVGTNSTGMEEELAKGTNKGNFSAFQWEQISTEHNRNKKRLHVVISCQIQANCSIPQGELVVGAPLCH